MPADIFPENIDRNIDKIFLTTIFKMALFEKLQLKFDF